MKYKNILITGGAGFIGSNLSLKMIELGYSVTILDALSPQIHGENSNSSSLYLSVKDRVNFIKGDILNRNDWRKALKSADVVVHLAAETGTGQSMYEVEKYVDVNIKGAAILLDILANESNDVKKILIASSRSIYGEGKYRCADHGIVYPAARLDIDMANRDYGVKCPICRQNVALLATDEESKLHPSSIYGITKQVQEQMFMTMGMALGIPAVAFRYQNVFGVGQSLSNPYTGILSIFSTRIKNNNDITIFEDGLESRDFIYVDDVVSATILGIESDQASGEVFNVGFGRSINVLEVAQSLIEAFQSKSKIIISHNYRLGDIRHNYADITKIKNTLGFMPAIDFKEGVSKFSEWVNAQTITKDLYETSIQEMRLKGLYK